MKRRLQYFHTFYGVSQQWFYLCVDQNSKTCYIAYKKGLHNKEFNSWTFKTFSSSKLTGNNSATAYDYKQQMKQWFSPIVDKKQCECDFLLESVKRFCFGGIINVTDKYKEREVKYGIAFS